MKGAKLMKGIGTRFLLISKESKAYKIPKPNNSIYKPVPELNNQEVLEVNLIYGTENRKPSELIRILFDRIILDHNGGYEVTWEGDSFSKFIHLLSENQNNRINLPMKPVLPTEKEKTCILNYIKTHLQSLYENAPYILEAEIKQREEHFKEEMIKAKKFSKDID
jgi:hypothetical protein